MNENKIFFIGFNKTGTTTYHEIFKNVVRSVHDSGWPSKVKNRDFEYFDRYDCFSDGECPDYETLHTHFPGSKFILNTRGLHDWIMSRIKHIYRSYPNVCMGSMAKEWHSIPCKDDIIIRWIKKRNLYYERCLEYFKDKDNFLILNINDPELIDKLKTFTGLNLNLNFKTKNVRRRMKYKDTKYWDQIIMCAFNRLHISPQDYNSDLYLS